MYCFSNYCFGLLLYLRSNFYVVKVSLRIIKKIFTGILLLASLCLVSVSCNELSREEKFAFVIERFMQSSASGGYYWQIEDLEIKEIRKGENRNEWKVTAKIKASGTFTDGVHSNPISFDDKAEFTIKRIKEEYYEVIAMNGTPVK